MLLNKLVGANAAKQEVEEATPENPLLVTHFVAHEDLTARVGTLQKYVEALQKSNQGAVETGWQMAATVRTTGETLQERKQEDAQSGPLGVVMTEVSEFCRRDADARSTLDLEAITALAAPIGVYVADLKDAHAKRKEHQKKRDAYISARVKASKKGDYETPPEQYAYEASTSDNLAAFERMQKKNEDKIVSVLCNEYVDGMEKYVNAAIQAVNVLLKDLPQHVPENKTHKKKKTTSQRQHENAKEERLVVLSEMLATEKEYLTKLQTIAQLADSWDAICNKDPKMLDKVNKQEALVLFSETKVLMAWQVELVRMLESWSAAYPNEQVGQFMLANSDRWKWYLTYIENLPRAQEMFRRKMAQHASFKKVVKSAYPLLDAPYNKIEDWTNFLQKMNKHTETDHPGHTDLKKAYKFLSKMTSSSIAEVKIRHNRQKSLLDLNSILLNLDGTLIAAHRWLLLNTVVKILLPTSETNADAQSLSSEEVKGQDKRNEFYTYLCTDLLLYASETSKKAGKYSGGDAEQTMLKFEGKLSLYRATVEDLKDTDSLYNAIQLTVQMPPVATSSDPPAAEAAAPVDPSSEGWKEGIFTLVFLTLDDKRKWLPTLRSAIENINTSKVFGVPLEDLMRNNPREKGRTIPRVLEISYDFITTKSLDVVGIFRQSGSAVIIKDYKAVLDIGDNLYIAHNENDHNIAGLLKMFIRDLPEPLLTYDMYPEWNRVGHAIAWERENHGILSNALGEIRKITEKLPAPNKYFLQVLMKLLHMVSLPENSAINMMTVSNLSIVFAPILLIKKNASPFDTSDFKASNMVVATLIGEYPRVFEQIEKERLSK